jgi:hypothetical protein
MDYPYTADRYSNGNIVGKGFPYSDDKEKLNEYIRQNPREMW